MVAAARAHGRGAEMIAGDTRPEADHQRRQRRRLLVPALRIPAAHPEPATRARAAELAERCDRPGELAV
jgi:hypothetical protein